MDVYNETEEELSSFSLYFDVILPIRIFMYYIGSYILLACFLFYLIYIWIIIPLTERLEQHIEDGVRKKNDDSTDRHAKSVRAARERLQKHHDKVAVEADEERRKLEKEKLSIERRMLLKKLVIIDEANLLEREQESRRKVESAMREGFLETPANFLLRMIESAPIVIVSESLCEQSNSVKAAFVNYKLPSEEILHLDLNNLGVQRESEIEAELQRLFGVPRAPAVFLLGDFIGGFDAIMALQKEGILDVLVSDAIQTWRDRQKIKDQ